MSAWTIFALICFGSSLVGIGYIFGLMHAVRMTLEQDEMWMHAIRPVDDDESRLG